MYCNTHKSTLFSTNGSRDQVTYASHICVVLSKIMSTVSVRIMTVFLQFTVLSIIHSLDLGYNGRDAANTTSNTAWYNETVFIFVWSDRNFTDGT